MSESHNQYTEMRVVRGPGFIMDIAPDGVLLRDGKSEWLTEWHPWHGPAVLSKRTGDPLVIQPGEHSRFWLVAVWWKDQGAKVVDGVGVWTEPERVKQKWHRLNSRNLVPAPPEATGPDIKTIEFYEGYEQWGPIANGRIINES